MTKTSSCSIANTDGSLSEVDRYPLCAAKEGGFGWEVNAFETFEGLTHRLPV